MWGKRKETPQAPARDLATELDVLNAEIARLDAKLPELADRAAAAAARGNEAEARAAGFAYRRDVDNDVGVDLELEESEASADGARREQRRLERNIGEVRSAIIRLRTQQAELKREAARAAILAYAPDAEAAAAKVDAGLALISEGRRVLRDIRIAQTQLAAGVLPEPEVSRFHNLRSVDRKVTWTLGSLGIIPRPMSGRYTAEFTCEQLERDLQRGVAPADDAEEPADVRDVGRRAAS